MDYEISFRFEFRRNSNLEQMLYEFDYLVWMLVCFKFELNFSEEKWSLATIDYKTNEMPVIDYHSVNTLIRFQQKKQKE